MVLKPRGRLEWYGGLCECEASPPPPERSGPTGSEPPVPMIDRFDDGVPLLIVEGFNDEGSSPRAPSPSRYIADENEMNALGVRSPDQNSTPPVGLAPARSAYSVRTKYRLSGRINSHSTLGSSLSRRLTRIHTPPTGSLALPKTCPYPYRSAARSDHSVPRSAEDLPVSVRRRPVPSHSRRLARIRT